MKKENSLLSRYYSGETSLEEEAFLKEKMGKGINDSTENNLFSYFSEEGEVPVDLEQNIFDAISEKQTRVKKLRNNLYRITSVAAMGILLLSISIVAWNKKQKKLEQQFFVMEKAMFQMSQSIQPQEQDDMLVLWVDDNVEIIIN